MGTTNAMGGMTAMSLSWDRVFQWGRMAAAGAALVCVTSCSAVQGAQQDVERAGSVAAACKDTTVLGKDAIAIAAGGINGGLDALEYGNEFIDAVTTMDSAAVTRLGAMVGQRLPKADASRFRAKLDQYGKASAKCRAQATS